MIPVLQRALRISNKQLKDIDLIAVTEWPWLIGSLLVWISTANMLSVAENINIVWVPHIWGHMYANMIGNDEKIKFPALVLTVSWGHNDLYLWENHGQFKKLWYTLDDASWEAFDKCWRLIGLPYPAGAHIWKLADLWDENKYNFPRPMSKSKWFNFSFSWLKTAFLYKLEKIKKEWNVTEQNRADLAASLQKAIADSLLIKVKKAMKEYNVKEVHLSWWVSANTRLRELFKETFTNKTVRHPKSIKYCTDNAAMIATCAYFCNFKKWIVSPNLN